MIDIIYNEDCIEGMKRIPDGSVDAIICDPPFGITDAPFDIRIGSDLIQSNRKMFRYEWIWEKNLGMGFLWASVHSGIRQKDLCTLRQIRRRDISIIRKRTGRECAAITPPLQVYNMRFD